MALSCKTAFFFSNNLDYLIISVLQRKLIKDTSNTKDSWSDQNVISTRILHLLKMLSKISKNLAHVREMWLPTRTPHALALRFVSILR